MTYECEYCKKEYGSGDYFLKHLQRVHGEKLGFPNLTNDKSKGKRK